MSNGTTTMDFNELVTQSARDFALGVAGVVGSFLGINRVVTIFKQNRAEGEKADAIAAKAQADTAIYERLLHALDIERGTRASLVRKLDQQNELMELQSQQLYEQAKQIKEQSEQIREQSDQIKMLTEQIRTMKAEHSAQTKALRTQIIELGGNLSDFRDSHQGEFR